MLDHRTQKITAPATPVNATSPEQFMEKILEATRLEQAGDLAEAQTIYEQVVAQDPQGNYGKMARKALNALTPNLPAALTLATPTQASAPSPPVKVGRFQWQNLSLRTKQTLLLTAAAAVPIVSLTAVNLIIAQESAGRSFDGILTQAEAALREEYIEWIRDESLTQADALARLIEDSGINLNNPEVVNQNRVLLQSITYNAFGAFDNVNPELTKSFRLITDAKGTTVVQYTQIYDDDYSNYPPLPTEEFNTRFSLASSRPGTNISDLPIFQAALASGEPVKGVELLSESMLRRLALNRQATIPLRPEAGEGNYENGLVSMAVQPVKLNDQELVGLVVVGTLLNRNLALTDNFRSLYGSSVISIFSEDVLTATTAAYSDGQTRAIGIKAPPDVVGSVLEGGQSAYFGVADFAGENHRVLYAPLYDHTADRDPTSAKPIGMLAIGEPLSQLRILVISQVAISGLVGAGIMVLAALVAIGVADSFSRPVRELADFAARVGSGQRGVRVKVSQRQDEIGSLARSMNEMASSIETSITTVEQQEALRRQEAEQQRREKERLQQGVMNLLLEIEGAQTGDLTVYAPMTEGAVGSIADAFNATIRSLRQLVLQVKTVAAQVEQLSRQSESSVQQLSLRALAQSAEVAEALAAVDEITRSIRQVAHFAQEAATIAQQAAAEAQEGDSRIEQTVTTMDLIRQTVGNTAEKVERLTKSSQEIAKIITLISSISEKTNLLAYNASVEAMRAGEHGQGFRVVADEVRRLAQQVTDATKSIEQLVGTIQIETTEVSQAMVDGTIAVTNGTELVGQVQKTLRGLATLNQQIDHYLQTISGSTTAQTETSQQVNQIMDQVATTAQQTSGNAQGVGATLQSLAAEVRALQESMSRFRLES
ncbi:MAG: methyl-accepting chemotaxis protein [Cyanobacteriota bacterium]|nr:methyl-accepting chemotaxis protein [Cyanobacteriota bacterium]